VKKGRGRDGGRRREGAPVEMKVPLTKILNMPQIPRHIHAI